MIALVEDIAANDKLFSDPEFIKTFEINYDELGRMNQKLVVTVRDTLRGDEPKKIFDDWGKKMLFEITKIDFV
jgi:hypothetical protein